MPRRYLKPMVTGPASVNELARLLFSVILEVIFKPLADITSEPGRKDNARTNNYSTLEMAISKGLIRFNNGVFSGNISAKISKDLKEAGAKFVRGKWRLPTPMLPPVVYAAVKEQRRITDLAGIQIKDAIDRMPQIATEMIKNLDIYSIGGAGLNRVSRAFKAQVNQALSVLPEIGPEGRERYQADYIDTELKPIRERILTTMERNAGAAIENFAHEEIAKLRETLSEMVIAGRPRQELRREIYDRLEIERWRCKFIARQETALATVEYQKAGYNRAGIGKYKWVTVGDHVVRGTRPNDSGDHKALNGKIFSWASPPPAEYFSTGTECHPGQDYNCRCVAQPIVEW